MAAGPLQEAACIVWIPGPPVAQGRPRFTTQGGRPRAVDPQRSREWKQVAAHLMRLAMQGRPPFECPIELQMIAVFSPPKRTRLDAPATLRVKKPDIENLVKSCLDAGNGVLYRDDAQVVRLKAEKWTAAPTGLEGVRIDVRPLVGQEGT